MLKFPASFAGMAFCDVRGLGNCRTAELTVKTVYFVTGIFGGDHINPLHKDQTALPHFQVAVALILVYHFGDYCWAF